MSDAPSFNLDPVTKITAGAVGEPGQRTFYIQGRSGDVLVSLLLEKGQVLELARHIEALLNRLAETKPTADEVIVPEADLSLEEPITPEFRVGPMALGYDADRDLVLLQCDEFVPQEEDEEIVPEADPIEEELREIVGDDEPTGATARFWATREQMRALARHGSEVVEAGRPRCRLCGGPIDPDGHFCPASNGHRGRIDLS